MTEKKIKLDYTGSKGWLIFWIVIFFPIALTLFATSGRFNLDGKVYYIKYDGSRNWLCFWVAIAFPIAFALLLLNGVSLVSDDGMRGITTAGRTETQSVPIV